MAALACLAARPAIAADACLLPDFSASPAAHRMVSGTIGAPCGSGSKSGVYAGTFNIVIDPPNQATLGYCVDLQTPIAGGDCQPQTAPPSYTCQVTYILNNFYPNGPVSAGLTTADEAAAVQAALWTFTDCFTLTGSDSPNGAALLARWNAIVAAANANYSPDCADPIVPARVVLTPDAATNRLPADSTHTVTATVYDTLDAPMANRPVKVTVSGGPSGSQTFNGVTNASGQFGVTFTNAGGTEGVDSIVASTAFQVPVGLEFSNGTRQRIVLAGAPRSGTVEGVATKTWVKVRCGDGVVDQGSEVCDDGNSVDGDGCDSNCKPTACGNGIVTAPEQCDDGNLVDGDGCDSNCKPTGCGNGIVTAPEQCDDGNLVDGDGCSSTCQPDGEVCTDLVDNDGDGLIDCQDDDCVCQVFAKDPASITFRPQSPGHDLFRTVGRLFLEDDASARGKFGVLVTNATDVIYRAVLQPGDLQPWGSTGGTFTDPTAVSANGSRGGLYKVAVKKRQGRFIVKVKGYADLSAATRPLMGVQVVFNEETPAFYKDEWRKTNKGWILPLPPLH